MNIIVEFCKDLIRLLLVVWLMIIYIISQFYTHILHSQTTNYSSFSTFALSLSLAVVLVLSFDYRPNQSWSIGVWFHWGPWLGFLLRKSILAWARGLTIFWCWGWGFAKIPPFITGEAPRSQSLMVNAPPGPEEGCWVVAAATGTYYCTAAASFFWFAAIWFRRLRLSRSRAESEGLDIYRWPLKCLCDTIFI